MLNQYRRQRNPDGGLFLTSAYQRQPVVAGMHERVVR